MSEIPTHLNVDNLMPLMPESVRQEYRKYGGAAIFGFTPGVKHWLDNSTNPRIERWRNDLRAYSKWQEAQALAEQVRMSDEARELYEGCKGSVRLRAVIHPVIKAWMMTEHGRHVWKDPEALADTERLQPKLFFNK